MFGFFSRTRSTSRKTLNRPRLSVEQLETRDCPALILQSFLTVNAQVLAGHQVELTGTLSGADAADETVIFSGAVTGSTITDADGDYSFTTADATLGTVSAVALDLQKDMLGTASTVVAVDAPAVTLSLTYVSQQTVTLSGTLTDIDAAGQTVTFTGLVAASAVTDANGNFSYNAEVSGVGAIDAATTDLWGQASNTAEVDVTAAPTLTLSAQVLAGHQVQLTGSVSGAYAAGATVTFSGAVTGSVTTDANGNYTFTTSSASLGTVSAVAVDVQQHTSGAVSASVAESAPTITLAVTAVNADTVTLSGTVTDVDAAGESVAISGALQGSVTTDANGNFSFTLATSDLETVDVSTTDLWGETSNTAEVAASSFPPVIQNFTATQGSGNEWVLQGTVIAPSVQGLVITFGGLPSLAGQTVTVAANGAFAFTQILGAGEFGTATAQTTDLAGQNSNLATFVIG